MNNERDIEQPNPMKRLSIVKTSPYQFFQYSTDQKNFFSVNADIPVLDALEQADCFLDAAEKTLSEEVLNGGNEAPLYLLRFGLALLGSAINALAAAGKEQGNEQ
ncbi:DUF3077 domain-containing protein [Oxalobacter aliiformigenes]|uniref:DUF3077 domain-containing protein n=1 Tax=Oxalobacter aliiformigenes TaxID=2946593 RepID=UPI0022B03260|nr:DUF3077 domain-containing protein [Oxalobacter aliiformigenes]MCZ4063896.1 DUF3077 domain-containing protein [Oxalobacter aliiformigenes]WAV98518.1 DUF3077 domain-containing protein [Oxalobacter aliiformigenes]